MKSVLEFENNFKNNGFEWHKDFYPEIHIQNFCETFRDLLVMQAYKMRLIETRKLDGSLAEQSAKLCHLIESHHKPALDSVYGMLRETSAGLNLLACKPLIDLGSRLLDCPPSLLKIHMDGILINLPKNEKRLYTWHCESHYYPFRLSFLNLWTPVLTEKTLENGVMHLKRGAHVKHYDFNQYVGYSTVDHKKESFVQYDVIEDELKEFESVATTVTPNTLVAFHHNMPHRSNINHASSASFAMVVRIYDYRKDLTLSDYTGIRPYHDSASQYGYPNLRRF